MKEVERKVASKTPLPPPAAEAAIVAPPPPPPPPAAAAAPAASNATAAADDDDGDGEKEARAAGRRGRRGRRGGRRKRGDDDEVPSLYKIAEQAHLLETQLTAVADAKVETAYEYGVPKEVPPWRSRAVRRAPLPTFVLLPPLLLRRPPAPQTLENNSRF